MINISTHFRQSTSSVLVSNFDRVLYDAFAKAYDRGNKSAWQEVNQFVHAQVFKSQASLAIDVVYQLVFLPTFFYQKAVTNDDARSYLIQSTSVFLKSLSYYVRPVESLRRGLQKEGADKLTIHIFFEGVITYYHYLLTNPNEDELIKALGEFNQMQDEYWDDYDNRFQIRDAINNGNDKKSAFTLKSKFEEKNYYFITHRRVSLCLKSWAVFLFDYGLISKDRFLIIDREIPLKYLFFEDILSDILFIRATEHRGFLNLDGWDYKERDSDKIYNPPTVYDWIIKGLVFYLFDNDIPHFAPEIIQDDKDFMFLYTSVEETVKAFHSNIKKWATVADALNGFEHSENDSAMLDSFRQKEREILSIFEQLKISHDETVNISLKDEDIKKDLMVKFQDTLAENWKNNCISFKLFDYFINIKKTDQDDGLPYYGSDIFLQQFRQMFVENNYQQIHGSSDLGSRVGRMTDGTFLEKTIKQAGELPIFGSAIEALENCLSKLISNGFTTNLIIVPPEFSYRSDLIKSEHFENKNAYESEIETWGYYKKIPVITFFVKELHNVIIAAQFEKAFELELYENPELYFNRLKVQLREITEEEVVKKFDANPGSWLKDDKGFKLTEVQAKAKIRTSMVLEIYTRAKFTIINPSAVMVVDVQSSAIS